LVPEINSGRVSNSFQEEIPGCLILPGIVRLGLDHDGTQHHVLANTTRVIRHFDRGAGTVDGSLVFQTRIVVRTAGSLARLKGRGQSGHQAGHGQAARDIGLWWLEMAARVIIDFDLDLVVHEVQFQETCESRGLTIDLDLWKKFGLRGDDGSREGGGREEKGTEEREDTHMKKSFLFVFIVLCLFGL